MIVIADLEADGLKPTKIHCIAVKPLGQPPILFTVMRDFELWVNQQEEEIIWIFHNGLDYDVPVINRLTNVTIDPKKVIDTLVVSKTVAYNKFPSHSLKALGQHLGVHKGDYKGGWEYYNEEMGKYCLQDTEVAEAVFEMYRPYIFDPDWSKALRVEHDTQIICTEMHNSGFLFNVIEANDMLEEIHKDLKELEDKFEIAFPPTLTEVHRIKMRYTKDGKEFATVTKAKAKYPMTSVIGDELVCYEWIPFNPGSPKDRIDKLWGYKWKPFEKTKGHIKWERENKRSYYSK